MYINIKDFHPYLLRLSRVLLLLRVDGGAAAAVLLLLGPLLAVPHARLGVYGDLLGSCTGLELAGGELTLCSSSQQSTSCLVVFWWCVSAAHMPPQEQLPHILLHCITRQVLSMGLPKYVGE